MCLTTSVSKIRLPHICSGNDDVINKKKNKTFLKAKDKNLTNNTLKYHPKKRAIATYLTFTTKQRKIRHTFYPS